MARVSKFVAWEAVRPESLRDGDGVLGKRAVSTLRTIS